MDGQHFTGGRAKIPAAVFTPSNWAFPRRISVKISLPYNLVELYRTEIFRAFTFLRNI